MAETHIGRLQTAVEFNVLGPVTVADGAESLNLGGPKQRTVLAMLIAHRGRPVSNDAIAEAVYGDDASPRNRRNVQTYVSTLRSIVGEVIVREGRGWYLDIEGAVVDAHRFEDLYETVRSDHDSPPETSARLLREALALWRGHPYHDIESHGRLDAEVARLNEMRVAAQAARIDADLESGRHADLVGEIEGHIAEHPYSERFRSQHMLALYRAGRQREALRSYEAMRTLLVDDLGVDPTPELQDLEHRILEQDDSLVVAPRRQIQKKAILVADPGDPIELARLPMAERHELLSSATTALQKAVGSESDGRLLPAGVTTYAVFDDIAEAASAAERVALRLVGRGMRLAIDFGDVEVSDDGVSGAPVSRAAVLVSVAHRGQVLLSSEAQQAVVSDGDGAGLRFESLGKHELVGITEPAPVYQLLVGNPPTTFPPLETDQVPVPLPEGGDRSVPGFELREPIGSGSVGTLYRAYQPSVGREVMVEVIGRAESSDAEFIRHFEADAQRLALLDHPNINPLLDYWRDTEGAFLVYRWHRGGFLDRADTRTLTQIGSALSYAHSYGLVHGSLRPDRVVLDDAGNAYLMGFPVGGSYGKSSAEHPAYIAPEVLEGEQPTLATDVYGFAVLAHVAEAGELGADQPMHPQSEVLARALSEIPGDRPQDVGELMTAVSHLDGDLPASRMTDSRNPYKGLAAFRESDADDFFGRARATADLVEALRDSHFIAVVGPSGIGKSSVVRAGLIPALRRGAVAGSESWVITDMLPGSHPFLELERALDRVAVRLPADVRERFAKRDPNVLESLDGVIPRGADLLVVVDQFEELFTMSPTPVIAAFLELLANASNSSRARVVITLRADFLDRPLAYSSFGKLLGDNMVTIAAPSPEELVSAIATPSQRMGVTIDVTLVGRMVAEVHDRPAALPLLQHTLTELFNTRQTDLIDVRAYEDLGGVSGSLAMRAEALWEGVAAWQQGALKHVFLRLVTVLEDSAPTRRRVRVEVLEDLAAGEVIEAFARNRMLVFDIDPCTRAPTIEVAHESLLEHWPRLAGWIDEAREDLALSRRLDEAIGDWEASGTSDAYLLSGGRLAQHQAWTASTSLALGEREKAFLRASALHDDTEQSRRRRRRGWILAGFAGAAVVAAGFAVVAMQNAKTARAEATAANAVAALDVDPELALLLAVDAAQSTDSMSAISALHQGLQADRSIMTIPGPDGSEAWTTIDPEGGRVAVAGVGTSMVEMWEIGADEPSWSVELSDDPAAGMRSWSHLWFSSDGATVYVPLSLDGQFGSPDQGLYSLDADTGEVVDFVSFPCLARAMPAGRHFAEPGAYWAFDWGGETGEGGCESYGGAGVVDIESGEILFRVELSGGRPPTLSMDGRYLATSSEFLIDDHFESRQRVYDTSSGEVVFETDLDASSSVLSADGSRLLIGQNPTYLYEVETQERVAAYQGDFLRVFFSPDESRVIGAGPDGIRVFDTDTGVELIHFFGQTAAAQSAAVDREANLLVSSSIDGWVIDIAEPAKGDVEPVLLDHEPNSRFYPGAITAKDGYLLLHRGRIKQTTSTEPTPHRMDVLRLEDGETVRTLHAWYGGLGPGGMLLVQPVEEVGVTSPSGVEDATHIGSPRLIDAETGELIQELDDCDWYWVGEFLLPEPGAGCEKDRAPNYVSFNFSADGSTVLAGTWDGAVTIWDTATGEVLRSMPRSWDVDENGLRNAWGAALSPDGSLMINMFGETEAFGDEVPSLHVLDVRTGEELAKVPGIDQWINVLEFDPHSGFVIGSRLDLLLIDPETWETTTLTRPGGLVNSFAISPDGALLATVGADEFIAVWDIGRQSLVAEIPIIGWIGEGLRGVAFEDDTTLIVAPEAGDQLLRFDLDTDVLLGQAFQSLNRGFRPEECATFEIKPCPTLEDMKRG